MEPVWPNFPEAGWAAPPLEVPVEDDDLDEEVLEAAFVDAGVWGAAEVVV